MQYSHSKLSINLNNIKNNLNIIKKFSKTPICPVIKANAYGHGLIPSAEALTEAEIFGVTDVNEADLLRASGSTTPILILQGIIERSDINRIAKAGYQVVIHHLEQLSWLEEELAKINLTKPLTIWLKINSGMGRLGITPADYVKTYQELQSKTWCKEVILMTHLANANLIDSALNQHQIESFSQIAQELPDAATSIPASSGLLAGFGEDYDITTSLNKLLDQENE